LSQTPLGFDGPRLAVAFGRALRAAGVPITPDREARFARALALLAPLDGPRLYWAGRSTLVSGQDQIAAYDRVFGAVLGGAFDPASARGGSAPPPGAAAAPARPAAPSAGTADAPATERAAMIAALADAAGEGGGRPGVLAAASADERLGTRSFDPLTPAELARLRAIRLTAPPRRSRRTRRAAHGRQIDLRATLRRSLRTGGEPVRLARRQRRRRPRRVVLLCDISGSMEPYSRAFLTLLQGAVVRGGAEALVFATRLTRLTRALRGSDPNVAIARAAALPPDWSGGTRIAAALKVFVDRHGRRGMARGAIVVILSDGWERGDPADLGREMQRLARLAHRIVWVNPRASAPGFEPLAGGMAAALPHIDALVGAADLEPVLAEIATI
jgi:uncharacterized protein with von Willebrand factor type A (vWA) domain